MEQTLEPNNQGTTNAITTVQKDNMVLEKTPILIGKDGNQATEEELAEFTASCETAKYAIRKLTPLEAFRLMGVSDEDANKMLEINSNSQCYKQAGNSIVVPVLMAIMSQLNINGITRWNDMTEEEIIEMIEDC